MFYEMEIFIKRKISLSYFGKVLGEKKVLNKDSCLEVKEIDIWKLFVLDFQVILWGYGFEIKGDE